jgi:hypothetical protein
VSESTKNFKVGDVVRVVRMMPDDYLDLVGTRGFVTEVGEERAAITAIKEDGSVGGAGSLYLQCLELEDQPKWLRAVELFHAAQAKRLREYEEAHVRSQERLREIGLKYNVAPEVAWEIHLDVDRAHERNWWPGA